MATAGKGRSLILLYRLLFLLYAEDRDLLPVRHPGYAGYALRRSDRTLQRRTTKDARFPAPRHVTGRLSSICSRQSPRGILISDCPVQRGLFVNPPCHR